MIRFQLTPFNPYVRCYRISYPSSLGRGFHLGFRPLHSSPSQPSLIRLTQMHSTCHKREGVISISYKYKARTILTDRRKTSASEHQAMAD